MFDKKQSTEAWEQVNAILDALDILEEVVHEAYQDAEDDTQRYDALAKFEDSLTNAHDIRSHLAHLLVKDNRAY